MKQGTNTIKGGSLIIGYLLKLLYINQLQRKCKKNDKKFAQSKKNAYLCIVFKKQVNINI